MDWHYRAGMSASAALLLAACATENPAFVETDAYSGSGAAASGASSESASASVTSSASGASASGSSGSTTGPATSDPSTDPTSPLTSSSGDPTGSSGEPTTTGVDAVCGDGVVEGGEACDDGDANSDELQGACRTTCHAAGCGDGVVDYVLGEECDDKDLNAGDGCSPTCAVEASPSCGDGVLDIDLLEECDDKNLAAGDGCSPTCQIEPFGVGCGDGEGDPLERCDDQNLKNGDGCNPTCNLKNGTTLFVGKPGAPGLLDGAGPSAQISGAGVLCADAVNLYLGDGENHVVRMINASNAKVTTIAGSPLAKLGDFDAPIGTNALFGAISAITTDGARLWVADGSARKIKEILLVAPYPVVSVAGGGAQGIVDGVGPQARFDDLRGLTYYAGQVYLVDGNGAVLRRFDPATKEVKTLAGTAYQTGTVDGYGASARMVSPRYIASDNSGILYIADTNGFHIRSYNTVTGFLGTFAGSGQAGYVDGVGKAASIHRPRGMSSDGTSIYFVEFNQHTVRQGILASGEVSTNIGKHCNGGNGCAGGYVEGTGTAALLNGPFSLAYHFPSGDLFVLDGGNAVIRRIH